MGESIKAEFDIFASKTQGSTGGLQRHNETQTRSASIQTKISKPDRTKDNIFSETEDDRTLYGERVDDRLEAGPQGAKAIRKGTQSGGWKQRYNLGAISPRKAKKRNANRGR